VSKEETESETKSQRNLTQHNRGIHSSEQQYSLNVFFPSIFWRVLTMVCKTQDYWVFGLCPSFGILKNRGFGNWICFCSTGKSQKNPLIPDVSNYSYILSLLGFSFILCRYGTLTPCSRYILSRFYGVNIIDRVWIAIWIY
jgi:hypothetical protein